MSGSTSIQKMRRGLVIVISTCAVGVMGYVIAGWSLLDAVYMVAITIYGVGYGEVRPINDPALKLFTLSLVITGCSSAIYVLGGFVQMIAEGEIQRALGARRMSRGIEQAKDHTIICGYGRVGQRLVEELRQSDVSFVIVDRNSERLADAEREGLLVVVGDASEENILRKAGVERAAVLATVLPGDAENVFVTLTARELNGEVQIIARGESEATERKLLRSGANRVVLPTQIGAAKIAQLIASPTVESLVGDVRAFARLNQDLETFGLGMMEIPIAENSSLAGSSIRDVELTGDGGHVVIAIKRTSGDVIRNPKMDETVHANDKLIVLSHKEDLPSVSKRAAQPTEQRMYRGVRYSG